MGTPDFGSVEGGKQRRATDGQDTVEKLLTAQLNRITFERAEAERRAKQLKSIEETRALIRKAGHEPCA